MTQLPVSFKNTLALMIAALALSSCATHQPTQKTAGDQLTDEQVLEQYFVKRSISSGNSEMLLEIYEGIEGAAQRMAFLDKIASYETEFGVTAKITEENLATAFTDKQEADLIVKYGTELSALVGTEQMKPFLERSTEIQHAERGKSDSFSKGKEKDLGTGKNTKELYPTEVTEAMDNLYTGNIRSPNVMARLERKLVHVYRKVKVLIWDKNACTQAKASYDEPALENKDKGNGQALATAADEASAESAGLSTEQVQKCFAKKAAYQIGKWGKAMGHVTWADFLAWINRIGPPAPYGCGEEPKLVMQEINSESDFQNSSPSCTN